MFRRKPKTVEKFLKGWTYEILMALQLTEDAHKIEKLPSGKIVRIDPYSNLEDKDRFAPALRIHFPNMPFNEIAGDEEVEAGFIISSHDTPEDALRKIFKWTDSLPPTSAKAVLEKVRRFAKEDLRDSAMANKIVIALRGPKFNTPTVSKDLK